MGHKRSDDFSERFTSWLYGYAEYDGLQYRIASERSTKLQRERLGLCSIPHQRLVQYLLLQFACTVYVWKREQNGSCAPGSGYRKLRLRDLQADGHHRTLQCGVQSGSLQSFQSRSVRTAEPDVHDSCQLDVWTDIDPTQPTSFDADGSPASLLITGRPHHRTAALASVAWAASVFLTISCGSRTPAVSEKRSDSGYVDPSKCAGCHADIAKNYRLTGMGRSFHHATAERDGKDYQSFSSLYNRASDRYYKGAVRGDELFQQRHQLGFGGKETNTLEKKVDFVIGSGNHARTYLSRTPDGQLAELPATWYAEKGGTWAMSPGYDRPDQDDFRRPIPYECMFCHNGYPAVKPGADLAGAKPVFDANLPEGIDCQRCHGPGAAHLAALNAGRAKPEEIRRTIVNPARLSRDRQLEV